MAYYAKISNQEFTVSENTRLKEARQEINVIEYNNRMSDEYATLKTAYKDSFTSATLQNLQDELDVLLSQYFIDITEEEGEALNTSITAKQSEIAAEISALIPGQETALANLNAKESEGTEDLVAEIETLNTAIANALCRVIDMYTGADEFVSSNGEVTEVDNSVYWEGFYRGCKRTSYNTQGGVHKLGGTPFRKNYAGVGFIYDPVRDAFYTEQPYASWILNEDTCYWAAPTSRPEGMDWYWKEDTTEWVNYYWQAPTSEQPYPSWTYDGVNWVAPVPMPDKSGGYPPGGLYTWNEETLTWEER